MIRKARITEMYQVNMYCDKCGARMKRDTSVVLTSYPPMYRYDCTKCDNHVTSTKIYPIQIIKFDESNLEEVNEDCY